MMRFLPRIIAYNYFYLYCIHGGCSNVFFSLQFQDCLNELNEVARHRPRLGLIITLAQVRDDYFIRYIAQLY